MQDLIMRNAFTNDARLIASVQVSSWRTTYAGIVSEKHLNSLNIDEREGKWKEQMGKGSTIIVAECKEIIGFIDYGISREKVEYDGEIYSVYILQEFQGKGIGKILFMSAIENMRHKGYNSMYLWVLAENPSRGFYEKMGGTIIDEKEIEIGGNILKEIAYGWRI